MTREGFRIAHDISAYSFPAVTKAALPLLKGRNGSVLTLTYLGAEKAIPNYNTMGLAKASLEASVRYRSEEHTSELQSLMRISYAVFCLKKKQKQHSTVIS